MSNTSQNIEAYQDTLIFTCFQRVKWIIFTLACCRYSAASRWWRRTWWPFNATQLEIQSFPFLAFLLLIKLRCVFCCGASGSSEIHLKQRIERPRGFECKRGERVLSDFSFVKPLWSWAKMCVSNTMSEEGRIKALAAERDKKMNKGRISVKNKSQEALISYLICCLQVPPC